MIDPQSHATLARIANPLSKERNVASKFRSALLACALASVSAPAFAQAPDLSSMRILSAHDEQAYRDAIADARDGDVSGAEANLAKADDQSLKGYVRAEEYLGPGHRVPVSELVAWLHDYAELPVAERVYRLAVARSTKRVRHHHHTILVAVVTNIPAPGPPARKRSGGYEDVDLPDPPLASEAAREAQPQIEQYIKTDQPVMANGVLTTAVQRGATPSDVARLSHRVAASYLAEGMDQQAFDLASGVDPDQKKATPLLYWDAGLAAYRLGHFHDAATFFEALAGAGAVPNWTRSAAAFWAARSQMQDGDPQDVVTMLEVAAKAEPTFYGLISARMLGEDTESGFADPAVNASDFASVMQYPAAHRAAALLQIGDRADAGQELNRAFGEMDPRYDQTVAALASKMNIPNLELRASESCASRGMLLTGLFPVPDSRPDGGYRIDPSLVLAFARIESRFQSEATSPVGARGWMQLMPATANRVAGPGAADRLYDVNYNLSVGQQYIEQLLDQMNGNLIELAAAYNAGPGALTRWLGTKSNAASDPLLFIESMPVTETRAYVKRMMTYHWMYRRRMGRDAKSLDETAKGEWPIYRPTTDGTQPAAPATQPVVVPANTQISDARPAS